MALISLFSLPGVVAIFLNKRFPKQSYIVSIVVRPIAISVVVVCVSLTAYDTWWTMQYGLDYRITMPPVLTLLTGLLVSCGVGALITKNYETAMTIMLQTCVPNPGFSLLFLLTVVPQPFGVISISIVAIYYITFLCCLAVYVIAKVVHEECYGEGRRTKNLRKMMGILRSIINPKDIVYNDYPTFELALYPGYSDEIVIDPKGLKSDVEQGSSVGLADAKRASRGTSVDNAVADSRGDKSVEFQQAATRAQVVRRMSTQIFNRVTNTFDDIYLGAKAAEASSRARKPTFVQTELHGSILGEVIVEAREEGSDDGSEYNILPAITCPNADDINDHVIIDPIDFGNPSKVEAIRRMSSVVIARVSNAVHRSRSETTSRNKVTLSAFNNNAFKEVAIAESEDKLDDAIDESESDNLNASPTNNLNLSVAKNNDNIDEDLSQNNVNICPESNLGNGGKMTSATNAEVIIQQPSTKEKRKHTTDVNRISNTDKLTEQEL